MNSVNIFNQHNLMKLRALALFVFTAALFAAAGYFAKTHYFDEQENTHVIYKINQQKSIIKHILVLSKYFIANVKTTTATSDSESSNPQTLAPITSTSLTSTALEQGSPLALSDSPTRDDNPSVNNNFASSAVTLQNIEKNKLISTRNELRDLGLQLENINNYLAAYRPNMPSFIVRVYYDDAGIGSKLNQFIITSRKLSQSDLNDSAATAELIAELSRYQQLLNKELDDITLSYYQYLVEITQKQQTNYWLYSGALFILFSIFIILFLLNPLVNSLVKSRKEADAAIRTKTDFLTCVSHEIRTPMHAIISATENLQTTTLDRKQGSYVRTVMSSAETLLDVINDILGYSSLDSGEIQTTVSTFNLNDLVNDLIQLMAERADAKNLNLILRFEDDVPHEIVSDHALIRQVLYHLVSNAIKFTERGYIVVTIDARKNSDNNYVTTSTESTKTAATTTAGEALLLHFTVEDTGIGIEPHLLESIFQQFVQAHNNTQRRLGGNGLGLAICKKTVELMGGKLHVSSVAGEGSTFSFTLPLQHQQQTVANINNNLCNTEHNAVTLESIALITDDENFGHHVSSEFEKQGLTLKTQSTQYFLDRANTLLPHTGVIIVDYFITLLSPSKLLQLINEYADSANVSPRIICLLRKNDNALNDKLSQQGFGGVFVVSNDLTDYCRSNIRPIAAPITHNQNVLQPSVAPAINPAINYLAGATILLVEDNRINAVLAEDMLLDFGAQVIQAENGEIAVDFIKNGTFVDLVLMDCMMPVMDGFEAARSIRTLTHSMGYHLPIVALTANAMPGDKERCLAAGMDAYLAKPVRKKDLKTMLNQWLSHRTPSQVTASSASSSATHTQKSQRDHTQNKNQNQNENDSNQTNTQAVPAVFNKPVSTALDQPLATTNSLPDHPLTTTQRATEEIQKRSNSAKSTKDNTAFSERSTTTNTISAAPKKNTLTATVATPKAPTAITTPAPKPSQNSALNKKAHTISNTDANLNAEKSSDSRSHISSNNSSHNTANTGAEKKSFHKIPVVVAKTAVPLPSKTATIAAATTNTAATPINPSTALAEKLPASNGTKIGDLKMGELLYLDTATVIKAKTMMKKRFSTMIEYYLEDTQIYIDQIIKGLNNQDYNQLVVPAHTIKSSSRQMGAFSVSEMGKELEDKARAEEASFEELRELTYRIQEQFDLSRIDFNHLLSEAG